MTEKSRSNEEASLPAEIIVKANVRRKWQSYIWDALDKTPEERKFLFKLDAVLLTFASLGYFIKYLDQSNINNAFVSGMKEDLGLNGNQLNYMQTCWTVGYVIGEIPSNIILTRIRPSIWMPTMELVWTVLTFCLSRCNSANQIYALRFFIGLAESAFYPGMQYIIGLWYRKDELAKRSCIFHTSSAIATMFSGYLMATVYHLGGKGGFKGWQWLFIVDGVISLPIALAGYVILPDVPEISRAFYFKKEELAFAKKRMELEGRKNRAPTFNNAAAGAAPIFAQFLKHSKSPKYTVSQINVYPTTTYAVQVVSTLAYAWLSDTVLKGARWPPIVFGGNRSSTSFAMPLWLFEIFLMVGGGPAISCLVAVTASQVSAWRSWAHEICADDNEERAIVIATMNEMAYVLQAWLPLIVWQQVDAPQYQKGFITISCLSVLLIITAFVTRYLHKRQLYRQRFTAESDAQVSDVGTDTPPEESVNVQVDTKAA
ncbi:hypothetical protein H2203_001920 [Taxawa tesnikishii (nom. ined.)]|nr:hypothetical protein H2203_001920 [Dothideales sp. JES 119]